MSRVPFDIVWTVPALEDRRAIYASIEADNARAAVSMDELIERKVRLLRKFPLSARTGRVAGTRELVVHRHYMVVYDLYPERGESPIVRVLRVLHTSRQWPPSVGS